MRIAVIGTGISGMSAAYLLQSRHEVTVFEKNAYVGGHSRTINVTAGGGSFPVDTGFIVFNHRNYPLLTAMFAHLGVATQESDMSFGASIGGGMLEYGSKGMFAQPRNLLRPAFWGMIADILRFNRTAEKAAAEGQTLGELLDQMNMGAWFRQYYLQAMGAAIWSCSVDTILKFPAATFIRFFSNHGLLTVNDHPQWHTVTGGSRAYVERLVAAFNGQIHLNTGISRVTRHADHVVLTDVEGREHVFDHVVFAGHADDTLAMLADADAAEKAVLSAFSYQDNYVVTHSDASFMPRARGAWASWVYLSEGMADAKPVVSLSYWMNSLQGIPAHAPVFVTLNPGREPAAALVHDRHVFKHPVFTREAIAAQAQVPSIQGRNRSHYCGAWQRYGFHEDGLMSAVAVARALGADIPWA